MSSVIDEIKLKMSKKTLTNKNISSCISDLEKLKEEGNINITKKYNLIKKISSGKSGALVFVVEDEFKEQFILKFYNLKKNSRPFREILCMCALSGEPGFPELVEFGYADKPISWASDSILENILGLYVVMRIIKGEELSKLNIKIGSKNALTISLGILYRIIQARIKLGPNFEHFDLHPENIFIDTECKNTTDIEKIYLDNDKYVLDCPKVSIIDFDLVEADKINFLPYEKQQKNKRYGYMKFIKTVVPEKTWLFINKWHGNIITLFKKLLRVKNIKNTDVRNWLIISSVLFEKNNITDTLEICNEMEDCLIKNKKFFDDLIEKN